jgi:toluene methyl-monooxygenase electron transfer component
MLERLFNRTPKTHQVHVEPFGTTLTVGARETILKAALKAGLAYPHECQTGACSTCRTQLIEGDIKALTDFAYVLDVEEMQGGTILACQSLARSDLKIRVDTLDDGLAAIPPRRFNGRLTSVSALTRDILDVRIALDAPISYYAGQYANLSVPGVEASRSYSFAEAPAHGGTNEVCFHIRLLPNGEVSGWFAAADRAGEPIGVDGPYGVFRLREADVPILCIAGGSGMAPIKAILEHGGRHGLSRPVVYLYGGRTRADLYDDVLIETLTRGWAGPIRFLPVLSEESEDSDWGGARGFVTDFIKSVDDFTLQGCQAYLCGPPGMIDAAVPILRNAGVRGRDIYFDKFTDRSHR